MKRIVDDPARVKPCSKCGVPKVVTAFYKGTNGYPSPECKECHRHRAREDYRRRYRARPEFREAEIRRAAAKSKPRYWRARPMDEGAFVRICNCHGKVCRVWLVDDTIRCSVSARPLRRFRVEAA